MQPPPGQEAPVLIADREATSGVSQMAHAVLVRLDRLLADNADAVHTAVTGLSTFAGALARNSDRLDGIIAGLERLTGAAPEKPAPPAYELTAPTDFPQAAGPPHGQLVIPEPTAVIAFDTQKILLRSSAGTVPASGDVHWSDNLPKLVQAKLVQTFENARLVQAVARPFEGLVADYQLLVDIRRFDVSLADETGAEVEFAARLLGRDGRIEHAQVFRTTAPSKGTDAAAAATALSQAFGVAARDLVMWAAPLI
jgi:phospholipid/cholesterol/gamma-HCH transport system substrate-binding protein